MRLQRFWHVTLPMLKPVLIASTAIDMITTVTTFDLVKIMTNGGPMRSTQTLAFYIWQAGFRDVNLVSVGVDCDSRCVRRGSSAGARWLARVSGRSAPALLDESVDPVANGNDATDSFGAERRGQLRAHPIDALDQHQI